jgi:hypothetical protein
MRTLRTTFLLVLTVIAVSCGRTDPEDDRPRLPPGPSPIPVETPQRTVSGGVQSTAVEPLTGAQVAIVGTGLSTMTDGGGRFELKGDIDNAATVQVAKDGFISQTRPALWTACAPGTDPCLRASLLFILNTVAPAQDIAGQYSLAILADPACADLPAEARARTYTATISSVSPDNTSVEVTIGGPPLLTWESNAFNAGVAGDRFRLQLIGSWIHQAMMEEVAPLTYVGFSGYATASVQANAPTFTAALDGSITSCRTSVPLREPSYQCESLEETRIQPETFVACSSKNHRMVFTRR